MDEVISRARHILKGVNTTPEYLAVDAVKRVGPGGNYLGDAHTASISGRNGSPPYPISVLIVPGKQPEPNP